MKTKTPLRTLLGASALSTFMLLVACDDAPQAGDAPPAGDVDAQQDDPALAVITFDAPLDAGAVVEFTHAHALRHVAAYAYAEQGDGAIGTLITRAAPEDLEATLQRVGELEGVDFIGIGAIVIDADDAERTSLRDAPSVLSIAPAGAEADDTTDDATPVIDAWSVLRDLGYVEGVPSPAADA